MESPVVGILGGVGPMATVYFMEMLLNKTEATKDQDHLNMLVSNHATIPDRTAFIMGDSDESPLNVMVEDAVMLEKAGCDFVVLPCNTAHYFFDKIQKSIKIPFLNIIKETVAYCERNIMSLKKIGIMGTVGTVSSNTYGMVCESKGIECIAPPENIQKEVTKIIYDEVKAGKNVKKEDFTFVIDYLREQGCDAVILGCTELSVAFADLDLQEEYPFVVDSLTVLAEQTILFAGKKLKK